MIAKTERFEMRLDQETLDQMDAWRSQQFDVPSRSETARRLIEAGLAEKPKPALRFSPGERLMIHMLCDLFDHLKVKGDVDPKFITSALVGGHYWGLRWQYSGLFHDHEDNERNVREVTDILDMWSFLEEGYETLSKKDKDQIKKDTDISNVLFPGFDGNNETEHMGIAHFMVNDLRRFTRFTGRDLNAHMPTLDGYRRMFGLFERIRPTLIGAGLTATQIVEILKARRFPG